MSAEILRRAALLMRERADLAAEFAFVSPRDMAGWACDGSMVMGEDELISQHYAPLSPAVALAVADWLESAALGWLKEQDRQWGLVLMNYDWQIPEGTEERNALQRKCDAKADGRFKKAIAVARVYLGGVSA